MADTRRMTVPLNYLDFDYSEDAEGAGTFDAMASLPLPQREALRAEVAQVLDWATRDFPGPRGPLEEGGEWDCDLQERTEPAAGAAAPWFTVHLAVGGTPAFCAALRERFGLA